MNKITTYQNSISFCTTKDPQIVKYEIFERFQMKLENLKASSIKSDEDSISYKVDLIRFVHNWNLLNPISDGDIRIETYENKINVKYQIKFTDLFVISCLMAFASILIPVILIAKIIIPLVIFLIFYGLNVLICILRYQHFIKKTISKVLEKDIPLISIEQEEWIADNSKCDACGASLNPTDKYCQSCGLLVRIDL